MKKTTYMDLSQQSRQEHLNLTEDCVERGGSSQNHKGVLAEYLNTDIFGRPVDLCHACHNPKCSNPRHLYWGTRSENVKDAIQNGTYVNPWDKMKDDMGEDAAREFFRAKALKFHEDRKNMGLAPQHKGTIYINDGNTSKRIPKDEDIPVGWTRGRVKFS